MYYHLSHGFQSAFQTLGMNHPKYTPIIKGFGKWYSILIALGFAIIPIIYFFFP
jgi:succinate dehydrogenase / fumarate reductase cytochrome b subunit